MRLLHDTRPVNLLQLPVAVTPVLAASNEGHDAGLRSAHRSSPETREEPLELHWVSAQLKEASRAVRRAALTNRRALLVESFAVVNQPGAKHPGSGPDLRSHSRQLVL